MARVKRTTSPVAKVVGDQIARPHSGSVPKKVGPATELEAQALSGQHGRRAGSVRQVGPTDIRPPAGPTGSVRVVGGGNFEDEFARRGGFLDIPYARQSGAVTQVGPADRGYSRALEGTGGTGSFKSGRLPRSSGLITDTPLLKSGAGRKYPFGVFVGDPGTKSASDIKKGAAGGSLLINGSRRSATPPPQEEPSDQVTPEGPSIIPGHTGENVEVTVTASPAISGEAASALTDTTVTLSGSVNSRSQAGTAFIEWGLDDTYGTEESDVILDDVLGEQPVEADLTGLTPATEYHWRIVAENDNGITEGDDQTFTTDA